MAEFMDNFKNWNRAAVESSRQGGNGEDYWELTKMRPKTIQGQRRL